MINLQLTDKEVDIIEDSIQDSLVTLQGSLTMLEDDDTLMSKVTQTDVKRIMLVCTTVLAKIRVSKTK